MYGNLYLSLFIVSVFFWVGCVIFFHLMQKMQYFFMIEPYHDFNHCYMICFFCNSTIGPVYHWVRVRYDMAFFNLKMKFPLIMILKRYQKLGVWAFQSLS